MYRSWLLFLGGGAGRRTGRITFIVMTEHGDQQRFQSFRILHALVGNEFFLMRQDQTLDFRGIYGVWKLYRRRAARTVDVDVSIIEDGPAETLDRITDAFDHRILESGGRPVKKAAPIGFEQAHGRDQQRIMIPVKNKVNQPDRTNGHPDKKEKREFGKHVKQEQRHQKSKKQNPAQARDHDKRMAVKNFQYLLPRIKMGSKQDLGNSLHKDIGMCSLKRTISNFPCKERALAVELMRIFYRQ